MTGRVIRVFMSKKYGFIKGEDGLEYFFHEDDFNGFFNDLDMDIKMGRTPKVNYESVPSEKGPRAAEISRVDAGV